jgi:hypothetical protein
MDQTAYARDIYAMHVAVRLSAPPERLPGDVRAAKQSEAVELFESNKMAFVGPPVSESRSPDRPSPEFAILSECSGRSAMERV